MEKFARNEQFHRDNLKRKAEESRVYEATRARLQAEEKARRDKQRGVRLAALEQEITLEEAQLYVRTTVPDYKLESFRRWFRREYDGDTACLVAGVNEFMGITDEVAPAAAPVIAIASPEVAAPAVKPVAVAPAAPRKREGNLTTVRSRPDQAAFAQSVKENCYSKCVITGTRLLARCEAAHLVEHKHNGADHYTNGLLMRADIHALFDAGFCAIDPATLVVRFTAEALELDPDLAAYHGKPIAPTRNPINPDFLRKRWEAFTA
ncbi:HNH endonuclease [Salmonella enterica]|nr:HNH endonuclease [Salmonella enterica]